MSLPKAVGDCSVCPRLCRDVCPVAVHAGEDHLVPNEKMRGVAAALGHNAGVAEPTRLLACTDCGACSDYCLLSIPVASWLDEALDVLSITPQRAPTTAPPTSIAVDDIPDDALWLPTCAVEDPSPRTREHAQSPAGSDASPAAGRRCVPQLPTGHGAVIPPGVHMPALGSTCCGERLDVRVSDEGLRDRMAAAMVQHVPDGAAIVVCNPDCAGHLHRVAGERLRVLHAIGDPPDFRERGDA